MGVERLTHLHAYFTVLLLFSWSIVNMEKYDESSDPQLIDALIYNEQERSRRFIETVRSAVLIACCRHAKKALKSVMTMQIFFGNFFVILKYKSLIMALSYRNLLEMQILRVFLSRSKLRF